MANGVPEHEVWAAADAVLARGERPTVERVRTTLGRGSPARVGQLLEQWWEQLAQRLKGHALLPELPGEVAQTFAEAWRLALAHADTAAQTALTEEQNRLFAAQTELTQERKVWEIALAEAHANVAEAAAQLAQSEAQLFERQALVDQLLAQVADLQRQRDHLQGQLDRLQSELESRRVDYAATQTHIRSVEDRAHQFVDQARQRLKALQQQRERDQRDHAKVRAQWVADEQVLRDALRAAEQVTAHQAGRITALEATFAQWQQAPAAKSKKASRTAKSTPSRRASKKASPPRGRTR